MNEKSFWAMIDAAGAKARGSRERMESALAAALRPPGAAEVAAFQKELDKRMNEACTWRLWGAAYLLNDGCSDDGFEYFRALLIANGRNAFAKAVKDPDALAKIKLKFGDEDEWEFESFLYVPSKVYEELAGKPMKRSVKRRNRPAGRKWREKDLENLLPKLAKKCGVEGDDDDCPLSPGIIFRLPGPDAKSFYYFKVLGVQKSSDGVKTIVALLDHPPDATRPPDCDEVGRRKIRDSDPYNPNQWWDAVPVAGWNEPDSPRGELEIWGGRKLTPRECAIIKGGLKSGGVGPFTLWGDLVADAIGSFDGSEWPELELDRAPARLRELPLPKLRDPSAAIVKEFAGAHHRHQILHMAGSQLLFKARDFERAAAVFELGTRITPEHHGLWLMLGAVRYALGRAAQGENAWKQAIKHAPPRDRRYIEKKIARTRKAIDKDGMDCKPLSSGFAWANDD